MGKTDKIKRLTIAVTYYLENLPGDPSLRPAFVDKVADRFSIRRSVMHDAIQMLREIN